MTQNFAGWSKRAIEIAEDKKALHTILLDVRRVSSVTDYLVIATVENGPQMRAVREAIRMDFKEEGLAPVHMDGEASDRWSVLDYGGLIVHLMSSEARDFYRLENMWSDAKELAGSSVKRRRPAQRSRAKKNIKNTKSAKNAKNTKKNVKKKR